MSLSELKRALRKSAAGPTWRLGERAAANGRVALDEHDPDLAQYSFLVAAADGQSHEVFLWPDEAEWECDCPTPQDACLHAVAALIALEAGVESLATAGPKEELVALLSRQGQWLDLRFALRRGDALSVLEGPPPSALCKDGPLAHLIKLRRQWPGDRVPGRSYRSLIAGVLHCAEVQLDGNTIEVSRVPLDPVAVVDRVGRGYRLRLEPGVSEENRFPGDPSLAFAGGCLRPQGFGRLTELQRHQLRTPQIFSEAELALLTAEWLPALEKAISVRREDGVPEAQVGGIAARVDLGRAAGCLEVHARIVYGDPPVAELRGEELRPLAGISALPPRDRKQEVRLQGELIEKLGIRSGQRVRMQGSEAVRFVHEKLSQFGGQVRGREALDAFALRGDTLKARVRWTKAGLDLGFEGAGALVSAERVFAAWQRNEPVVALEGGGFAALPADWLAEHGEAVALLIDAGGGAGAKAAPHLAPLAAGLLEGSGQKVPSALAQVVDGLREGGLHPVSTPPPGFEGELRPYQLEGLAWLNFLAEQGLGGVLADDMGLGKTVQCLASLVPGQGKGMSLVVAPTSVLRNWQREAERFAPSLRCALLHGGRRDRVYEAMEHGKVDLVITSYALLRRDIEQLRALSFWGLVLDESQAIKNPASQTAQAARRLQSHHRLALSGTPIENRLSELWSVMEVLNPGFFGPLARFEERLGGPAAAGDQQALAILRARIAPFVLRRRKAEVAKDLPPRSEDLLFCPMSEAQKEAYAAVLKAARNELLVPTTAEGEPSDTGKGANRKPAPQRRIALLAALTRMRQAACHPALLPGGDPKAESGKLNRLMEALESLCASGHRALVFSQWTSLLDCVEPRLDAASLDYLRLDGSTRDRQALVERFQDPKGPPVFLISLKAGGTGLTLSAADHVFLLDPWWNPAVEQQAIDRAHRIGQTKPVFAWKLVTQGTVEERVLQLQERKAAIAGAVLEGGLGTAGLELEDLEALLAD